MSPNYSCINNFFLVAILFMMIYRATFNQFVDETTTEIELPFLDGKCSADDGIGSFMYFNVDFRFSKFNELLLANTKCLRFSFCSSTDKFVKSQFKIVNYRNEIWNSCKENWSGFSIVFCLVENDNVKMRISFSSIGEEMRNIAQLHSTISFFRVQFEPKNVRIFYQIDDGKKMEQLKFVGGNTEQQNFSFYNGNKMLQKNPLPWHVLLNLTMIKKIQQKGNYHNDENVISISKNDHFRIHHPEECVPKANSINQTILIECISTLCEFDKPNDEQCGKKCRKKKHHRREALISHGQSIIDETKWPWMVAIEMNFTDINVLDNVEEEYTLPCSGAIIHTNYVLTAGHCFKSAVPKRDPRNNQVIITKLNGVKIYAGHFDLSKPMQIIDENPANVIIHENFIINYLNESFMYMDIALIKLSKPLKFNEKIRSICLANFELQNDKIVHLAGWGFTEEVDYVGATPPTENNKILQESVAKIIDNGKCLSFPIEGIEEELKEIVEIEAKINNATYCLQGLDNSTIQWGDSGSPMMSAINGTWFTFGICSGGFPRGSLKESPEPVFYVKIDGQICDWIKMKTEGKVQCGSDF